MGIQRTEGIWIIHKRIAPQASLRNCRAGNRTLGMGKWLAGESPRSSQYGVNLVQVI